MNAIELQVMLGALRAACDEMGVVLVRSAHSANIKERRDASTALFDADGRMAMQAEHIPVHLGAMPAAVAAVVARSTPPATRGSSTTPSPAAPTCPTSRSSRRVSRAANWSASPRAAPTTPTWAARAGLDAGRLAHSRRGGRRHPADPAARGGELDLELWPTTAMRGPRERFADLRAQLAANRTGAHDWRSWPSGSGRRAARGHAATQDYAERRTRARIAELDDGERTATDVLEAADGDIELRLRATVRGDGLELDFSGSAEQHDGNLNCPLAVTVSACYFALRVLTDPDVPACEGAYRPLTVTAPEGSLLNARPPAAVAAGNVETSSRVADLVLAAFGHALGQGTMNNLTLGNERFTYYETLGGGQGACADADGPSAVHVAMSNTLNTPIEALELEFPVRAVEYAVRRGSGGAGATAAATAWSASSRRSSRCASP